MEKHVGLPKIDKNKRKNDPTKKGKPQQKKKVVHKKEEPHLVLLNTTRVNKLKEYFKSIAPSLFEQLVLSKKYNLYQFTGKGKPVFLVQKSFQGFINELRKEVAIQHTGINLGFFKIRRDRSGLDERFYLSFEGGRFLLEFIEQKAPFIKNELQIIKLDADGEKKFLYGREITLRNIITDTDSLVKRRLIFVLNKHDEYIGLALLKVKLIGSREFDKKGKYIEKYSRSDNFMVSILNLADPGQYLRKEH